MKKEVYNLWKICFNDPEEFTALYFDKVYRDENTRVIRENGKIISALQMLPYPMTWHGTEVATYYISGASTFPEYRGKGVMTRLLTGALGEMKSQNGLFSLLIPQEEWLYDYYARMGYASVLACTPEQHDFSSATPSPSVETPDLPACLAEAGELYRFFNQQMRKRPDCVQHTAADFNIILEDLYLSGGRLFVFREPDGHPGGLAFARPGADTAEIGEILFRAEKIRDELLETICHQWNLRRATFCRPEAGDTTPPRGMARILNTSVALEIFAATHPEKKILLEVRDDILQDNNGFFRITNGHCFRTDKSVGKPDFRMDIRELAGYLFTPSAFISLMLE